MIEVILLMAGQGKRFSIEGYDKPKPLIDVNGHPMFYSILENIFSNAHEDVVVHIVILKELWEAYKKEFRYYQRLYSKFPGEKVEFVILDGPQYGQAFTLKEALKVIQPKGDFISRNCDDLCLDSGWLQNSFNYWREHKADGGIVLFLADGDPKWSYAKIEGGVITEVAEKKVISQFSTFGGYYWRSHDLCLEGIDAMIEDNHKVNGELYITPSYNYLLKNKYKIIPYLTNNTFGIGTPPDLRKYLEKE